MCLSSLGFSVRIGEAMSARTMAEQMLGGDYALVIAGTPQMPWTGNGFGSPSLVSPPPALELIPGASVWQLSSHRVAPSPPGTEATGWNCWICSSPFHLKNQCPHNKDRTPPDEILCWQCERYGHYSWQCLTPAWAPMACLECGDLGHLADTCPILSLPRYSCETCYIHGKARGIRQVYVDVEGRVRCKEDQACPKVIANAD